MMHRDHFSSFFQVVDDFMVDLNKTSGQQGDQQQLHISSSSSQPPLQADFR